MTGYVILIIYVIYPLYGIIPYIRHLPLYVNMAIYGKHARRHFLVRYSDGSARTINTIKSINKIAIIVNGTRKHCNNYIVAAALFDVSKIAYHYIIYNPRYIMKKYIDIVIPCNYTIYVI